MTNTHSLFRCCGTAESCSLHILWSRWTPCSRGQLDQRTVAGNHAGSGPLFIPGDVWPPPFRHQRDRDGQDELGGQCRSYPVHGRILQIPAVGPRQTCLVSPFLSIALAKRLLFRSSCSSLSPPPPPLKGLQSIPHATQNWFNLRETSTGRFYASIVIKLVVAEVLLNYDLKLAHENGAAKKETLLTVDSFRIPRTYISMRRKSFNGEVVGDNAWGLEKATVFYFLFF